MNENENNFDSLRRLLSLKRHETPPPGYFENFSREVTARIRAGEASRTADVSSQLSWLFRLLSSFEAKPAFAGGFASVLCLLLLVGIVYAERPDVAEQQSLLQTAQNRDPLAAPTPVALNTLPTEPAGFISSTTSTNPVLNLQPSAGWFGGQPAVVQPASFRLQ